MDNLVSKFFFNNKPIILKTLKWSFLSIILTTCVLLTIQILAQRSDSGAFAQAVVRTNNIDSRSLFNRTVVGIIVLCFTTLAYGIIATYI